jgi:uncharacterized protein YggE
MPDETLITVRGEAFIETEPEIAILGVSVAARDKERPRAVELAAVRTREVGDIIRGYGEAVQRLESQPVHVRPLFAGEKTKARPGMKTIGYLAQAGFSVTMNDFAVLGELVGKLASEDLVTFDGPSWQLQPDSHIHRDVRLAAARDSIRRARDYAEAFGGQIIGLAEAADSGLLSDGSGGGGHSVAYSRPTAAGLRMSARGGYDEPPEIDLIPAQQTVYAQVEARFLMTQPTLDG